MRNYLEKYKVSVPEGRSGSWRVERFEFGNQDAEKSTIVALQHGRGYCPPGTYTRLVRGGNNGCDGITVMSDTPDEINDHLSAIYARGRVLVAGLGLGVVIQGMLRNGKIDHVTVIEKSPDVVKLVADHYFEMFGRDRLDVIQADIFDWKPPKDARWDFMWFDIWDTICTTNRPEFTRLRRKFGRRCSDKRFWCEHRIERAYKEDREWERLQQSGSFKHPRFIL